jgi:hypothetical protein
MTLGTLLLVIFSFTVMPLLLAFICLISIDMQHTPVPLRALKLHLDGFIDMFEPDEAERAQTEGKPIPPLHAAFLANPSQDITTLMAMVASSERAEAASNPPVPQTLPMDPTTEYHMLQLEVQMQLGFMLEEHDGTVHLTRQQYRQLHQFCGFYFEDIQTPEQTLGRLGFDLQVR